VGEETSRLFFPHSIVLVKKSIAKIISSHIIYVTSPYCWTWTESIQHKIPLATMGVLASGSAHASPSTWPPINTSGIFQLSDYRVKNYALLFLKQPHCETKGEMQLQCVILSWFLKYACLSDYDLI
jgi:hypothetical protein